MANTDKAWCWSAQDFSEGEPDGVDKLAARFNSVEACQQFKAAFEAAKLFNTTAKNSDSDEGLVWAPIVEDLDEPVVDDIDTNKTADADGAGDDKDE